MAGITKLEAINACLRGIGRDPVDSEDDPDLDAALAATTIDEVTTTLCSQSWWFNKEYNWKLTPNTLGEIQVPNTAQSVVPEAENRTQSLVIRKNKLYDMVNHTFDMTDRLCNGVVVVSFLIDLDYEDLPPIARNAVKYIARREFAQDLEVDQVRWNFQSVDEERAVTQLQAENARHRRRNYLRDNRHVAGVVSRISGPNGSTFGHATFPKRDSSGVL